MTGIDQRYDDGRYLADHPDWHAERGPWKADHVMQGLTSVGVAPTSLCDIGCGTGLVVALVAKRLGIQRAVGFEPSVTAPVHQEAQSVVDIRRGEPDLASDRFDVALMLDVFEHVDDYVGFLRHWRPIASTFVFHVPLEVNALTAATGKVGGTRGPLGHLHYFSRRTALDTITHAGFGVRHWHYTKSGWDGPGKRPKTPTNLVRRTVAKTCGLNAAERLVGGLSLLVVADSQPT